ncbi:MAG: cupin domain-containing protein [Armatimonadota bacterium]
MQNPVKLAKGEEEQLFDAQMLYDMVDEEIEFRDVGVNNSSLVPGGELPLDAHDDKLEIVTPIALGETEGPVAVYTDGEGGYEIELASYDSIVVPRGVRHTARNVCDTTVILYITNFRYND